MNQTVAESFILASPGDFLYKIRCKIKGGHVINLPSALPNNLWLYNGEVDSY